MSTTDEQEEGGKWFTKEDVLREQREEEISKLKQRIQEKKELEMGPVALDEICTEICGEEDDTKLIGESDKEEYCSPIEYAVGPEPEHRTCAGCSSMCCCFKRVGNMIVVHESKDKKGRRQLNCLLGPCWPFMFFVTLPIILGITGFLGATMWNRPKATPELKLIYVSAVLFCLYNLARTSFSDPGILRRHDEPPPGEAGRGWRYTDQATSYRPPGAFYSTEAEVVFEGFDHVCPWTGTAIAKNNMGHFNCFLCSLVLLILALSLVMMKTEEEPAYMHRMQGRGYFRYNGHRYYNHNNNPQQNYVMGAMGTMGGR